DAAIRDQVIRRVEIDRIDVVDEFGDVDRIGGLEPQPFQIVGIDRDVMALLVLEPLDDLVAFDRADAGNDQLLSDPLARGLMDLMKTDALALGGCGVETHRDRHQRQFQEPGPIGSGGGCHRKTPISPFTPTGSRQPCSGKRTGPRPPVLARTWHCRSIPTTHRWKRARFAIYRKANSGGTNPNGTASVAWPSGTAKPSSCARNRANPSAAIS